MFKHSQLVSMSIGRSHFLALEPKKKIEFKIEELKIKNKQHGE